MTVHMSRVLGWKKVEKGNAKFGFVKIPAALNKRLATSILAAYDNPQEAGDYFKRTVDALLLKRTQILQ
jgi:hypothetical protein